MRHWGLCCVLAGSLAGMTGCGWQAGTSSAPAGGVAVVDLDEVATAVGAGTRLNDMVKLRQANLDNALGDFSTKQSEKLKGLLEEVKEKFGEEVPVEEQKNLRKEAIAANNNVQQARSKAQLDLNTFTEQLKQQFRAEVRPLAQEVAAKKGFSIVIPKNDGLLLSVDPSHDITHDVILALQSRNQKTAGAAKPTTEATAKPVKKKSEKTAEAPRERSKPKEVDDK